MAVAEADASVTMPFTTDVRRPSTPSPPTRCESSTDIAWRARLAAAGADGGLLLPRRLRRHSPAGHPPRVRPPVPGGGGPGAFEPPCPGPAPEGRVPPRPAGPAHACRARLGAVSVRCVSPCCVADPPACAFAPLLTHRPSPGSVACHACHRQGCGASTTRRAVSPPDSLTPPLALRRSTVACPFGEKHRLCHRCLPALFEVRKRWALARKRARSR